MNRLLVLLLAGMTALPASAFRPDRAPAPYVEGELLVRYRDDATFHKARVDLGMQRLRVFERMQVEHLRLPSYLDVPNAVWLLREDPSVEFAEPNFLRTRRAAIPNDPQFTEQWGLHNTGQANFVEGGPAGIAGGDLNLVEAWDSDGNGIADRTGDSSVIIAVIDDSVDIRHRDLSPNVIAGYDFVCDDNNPGPDSEDDFHGTLVAGCAAGAGNNGRGIAGVAWNASLMPLRFGFDTAGHIAAIEYARANGAHIINGSFGGPGFSQVERDAIANLADDDILYVAAAGNDDSNTDIAQLNYPANYDADNLMAVAATNRQDDIASFSQYGPLTTDVAAPGLQVVTTDSGGGYTSSKGVSGTSFAAPYIAGVAALLRSHVIPTPGYREIRARLIESGTAVAGANPKLRTTGGRVDADVALEMDPRPSLVIRSVRFLNGDGNAALDPGESLDVEFTIDNLWLTSGNVTATLDAGNDITVTTEPQALGAIASGASAVTTFAITVDSGIADHRYANFTLTLQDDSGYSAVRNFITEIGVLSAGVPVVQEFSDDLYDDFHAWHVDVPPGSEGKTLVIRTATPGTKDIDLLARHAEPPPYSITVGINPEDAGFFCTSGSEPNCIDPDTLISGRLDGVEAVTVESPAAGAWHLVVVNFVQERVSYNLSAELLDGDLRPDPFFFDPIPNVPNTSVQTSNTITVTGIDTPTFLTVTGGEYSVNGGGFTNQEGTVGPGDQVQLRVPAATDARAQLTIGGVTASFLVNPSGGGGGGGGGGIQCPANGGGSVLGLPRQSGGSGAPTPGLLLGLILIGACRRNTRRR